jgi:hypothetical protein
MKDPAPADSPLPLSLFPAEREPLDSRQTAAWLLFFLILGVAARTVRFALRFPLWEDECFLAVNLLDRDYLGLTRALDYYQVCPLLFLWVQHALVRLLGFHEWSLRLFSLLCGIGSLFLFRRLAGRLLRGTALVAAVAVFAVAYPGIRYATEAKQYGADLVVSLVLLTLAVEWWRRPARGWLWAMAGFIPLGVGLSYPAVFVGGGVSLFVAAVLLGDRSRRGWLPWLAFSIVMVLSFTALFAVSAVHQSQRSLEAMRECWQGGFPPLADPGRLVAWLLDAHTGEMLAYPVGGRRGGSALTFLLCAAGLAVLLRRRHFLAAFLGLAPLALSFVAAALGRYPYGQMTKFQIYMAPAFCLLAGIGIAAALAPRGGRAASRTGLLAVLAVLAAVGLGAIARDFWSQAKSPNVMRARDFARWFWFTAQCEGEVVCLKTDLGLDFAPATYNYGFSALYLCNQRVYSPRHARGDPPRWDRISADWPLRCVEYHGKHQPYDHEAAARWLASMQERYDLVSRERFAFTDARHLGGPTREHDYVEVYRFVPRRVKGR